jgi:hypothetical protein
MTSLSDVRVTPLPVAAEPHEHGTVWRWRPVRDEARRNCAICRPALPCFTHGAPTFQWADYPYGTLGASPPPGGFERCQRCTRTDAVAVGVHRGEDLIDGAICDRCIDRRYGKRNWEAS